VTDGDTALHEIAIGRLSVKIIVFFFSRFEIEKEVDIGRCTPFQVRARVDSRRFGRSAVAWLR
jgi:hypothetical protein